MQYRPGRDLMVEAAFFALCLALAGRLWTLDPALTGLLLGLTAAKLLFYRVPGDLLFLLGGSIVGGSLHLLLSRVGLYQHALPGPAGLPLWMLVFWALAVNLLRRVIVYVGYMLAPDEEFRSLGGPAGEVTAVLGVLALVGLWQPAAEVTALLLLALIVARVALFRESGDLPLLVVGMVVCTGVDGYLARHAVYRFAGPTVAGVPLWLPFLWGYLTLAARRAIRLLEARVHPLDPLAGG